MAWRPAAKTAEGHLLAVKALGDRAALERLAADYRGRFPELPPVEKIARARPVAVAAPAVKPCGALLAGQAHAPTGEPATALATGWCLMDMKRAEEAALAFETARHGDSRIAAEANYGQALAHLRSGRTEEAARVASEGGLTPARRDEIGRIVLAQQAIAHFGRKDWRAALDTLERRRAHVAEPRDLMTMRAWSLYHLGRRDEAHDVFVLLDRQLSTSETRSGVVATDPVIVNATRRS